MAVLLKHPNLDYAHNGKLYVSDSPKMMGGIDIDGLEIKLNISKEDHHKVFWGVKKLNKKYNKGYPAKDYAWYTNIPIYKNEKLLILFGSTSPGDPKYHELKIKFNPSKLKTYKPIKEILNNILPGLYSQVMNEGRISRIDIATMLYYTKIDSLLFLVPKIRKFKNHQNEWHQTETIYFGAEGSKRRWVVYNKCRELKVKATENEQSSYKKYKQKPKYEVLVPSPAMNIVRIEFRYTPDKADNVTLPDIAKLNPFTDFHISHYVDPDKVPELKNVNDYDAFVMMLEACQGQNKTQIQTLLKKLKSQARRKKFRKILKDNPAEFWKPEKLGEDISKAVKNLLEVPKSNGGVTFKPKTFTG